MNKDTNPSFFVDHTKLQHGLYKSKVDIVENPSIAGSSHNITTYDLRFRTPYKEKPLSGKSMHAIEHMMAVALRSDSSMLHCGDVIYFGPMGCCTGFYLILSYSYDIEYLRNALIHSFNQCLNMSEVPAASKMLCGNYHYMDYNEAIRDIKKYVDILENLRPEQTNYNWI